ncbi:MAG: Aminoacyltransferase FemX [Microgenomates group bacterium GW2011_GWA2_47_8]|nr:MAG: Aminoacyltransferase FemX [Microgenomates group bacterium GW2011_GWA2_47_8]
MKLRIDAILDRPVWEYFWEAHGPQAFFQSWLWGEVMKRQSVPLTRFGLYDAAHLVGIFQVATIRARRGTHLHVRHGPIVVGSELALWKHAVAFLKGQAKNDGASFVRISPQLEDSHTSRALLRAFGMIPAAVHEVDAERCWVLDITPSEDVLMAGMRKTTRYEIKRAIKEGIVIDKSEDPEALQSFFDLYRQTAARHRFVPHKGVKEEFSVFAKEHRGLIFSGSDHGETTAVAIVLFSGNEAIYHHGASRLSRLPVNYAIQWEAIRTAKKRGMSVYNFWGVAPDGNLKHPWWGHSQFKKGFGGSERKTIHAYDLPLSPTYHISRTIEFVRTRLRGYG